MIKYFKNLFSKKNIQNNDIIENESFRETIKKSQLTIDEKIELLIKNQVSLNNKSLSNNDHLSHDLGFDVLDITDLMFDLEYLFEVEIQELAFSLTVIGIKEYIKKKIDNPDHLVPEDELNFESPGWGWSGLANTIYNEVLYGRSMAIKELVENNYQIQKDEYENPFKELINFTLKFFFEKYIIDKPENVDRLLSQSFPIMHVYIKRYLNKNQIITSSNEKLDEQKAYDEFLEFCKNILCTLYPDKNQRDKQIINLFKIMHNSLIQFIENENE